MHSLELQPRNSSTSSFNARGSNRGIGKSAQSKKGSGKQVRARAAMQRLYRGKLEKKEQHGNNKTQKIGEEESETKRQK